MGLQVQLQGQSSFPRHFLRLWYFKSHAVAIFCLVFFSYGLAWTLNFLWSSRRKLTPKSLWHPLIELIRGFFLDKKDFTCTFAFLLWNLFVVPGQTSCRWSKTSPGTRVAQCLLESVDFQQQSKIARDWIYYWFSVLSFLKTPFLRDVGYFFLLWLKKEYNFACS